MKKRVVIIGGLPSSLVNFRGELIKDIVHNGHEVIAMASGASEAEIVQVEALGASYIDFPVQRNGLSPMHDFKTFVSLVRIFKRLKPDAVFAYTIKPIIWGGIAARFLRGVDFYALVTGLGFAFQNGGIKRNFLTFTVVGLYRVALVSSKKVIFQNLDNMNTFVERKIVTSDCCSIVHGSGVNLDYFKKTPLPDTPVSFLCIARLLGEKGLREYAQAAILIKDKYPDVRFRLLGPADPSPDGIEIDEVRSWEKEGAVEYLGEAKDVREYLKECHIYVLPSYHEGMPRTILEAMAVGRPILTTDVPGCRETVVVGKNGYLVQKASVESLCEKLEWFIDNRERWQEMADASYDFAVEKYDVRKVNKDLITILDLVN